MNKTVSVVGAGLAGCEAAWQLASFGIKVKLFEMKPKKFSKAHKLESFCELVCSNSLKSQLLNSASGMLKKEMELLNSIVVKTAKKTSVGAGKALAVNRQLFSEEITNLIKSNENIEIINQEIEKIPNENLIIATGPLTSSSLKNSIFELIGQKGLYFYDAIAPIILGSSIDLNTAFFASRYEYGKKDYLNCPMNKNEYEKFYYELIKGETVNLHDFDKPKVYEGCMPVEIMAKRGMDALRFGPLKPVGIENPRTGENYYAILQLRKENLEASAYNMVGFQTNLKFSEQKRIFSMIPGLEKAEFLRYGTMHKNTFINSPLFLNKNLSLKDYENIKFAGQITGVEGYLESAACGLIAGRFFAQELLDMPPLNLPKDSMIGALLNYITDEKNSANFQPMGVNMGLLPSLKEKIKNKQLKNELLAKRGIESLERILF